jgi:hypothetical protein
VRKLGLDDDGILELMAVVDLFSGLNKLLDHIGGHQQPAKTCPVTIKLTNKTNVPILIL